MVAPAPTAFSSSPLLLHDPGGIYHEPATHRSAVSPLPLAISSLTSSRGRPAPPDDPGLEQSRDTRGLDEHAYRRIYDPRLHHAPSGAGPLPTPHSLTLPPINLMTMSATISPYPTPDVVAPRASMTSREWIIPPRPKPGRKPATDTPPTKRKAQNRAAQRAFRERRAARVGELEEQLQEEKEDHEKQQGELKEKIRGLEMDLQAFRSRCLLLESLLERERKERVRAETSVEGIRREQRETSHSSHPYHHSPSGQQGQIKRDSSVHQEVQISSLPPIVPSLENNEDNSPSLTCGNCGPDACVCADEAMANVTSALNRGNDLKRPASPSNQASGEKRQRPTMVSSLVEPDHDQQPPSAGDDSVFRDSCGFCKEGTYCVCADTAMVTPSLTPASDTLPPIAHQTQTPPPSEPDAAVGSQQLAMEVTSDGAVKLPPRVPAEVRQAAPTSRGCGSGGPGTCAQCQADPKSGLFCRLMASKLGKGQGGCCGGKGGDGGCCKSKQPQSQPEKITLPSLPSLGLTCAETYQTLSSHRNFERASDDIGSWLPKLRATPTAESTRPSRVPMEVEAASIMSVLKDFDVRFGG